MTDTNDRPADLRQQPGVCPECGSELKFVLCVTCNPPPGPAFRTGQQPAQPEHDLGTRRYVRKGSIYAYPWRDGFSLEGISLSDADRLAGHPKVGGMVAINPDDPMDRWYIAPEFFAKHYAEGQPAQPGSGEVRTTNEDAANIGHALLEALRTAHPTYCWNDCPSEVVADLLNAVHDARAELTAAQQRVAELRERVRWRPMEEAPKDGSHVLLYRPHIRFVGYHSDAGWCINAPGLPLMQPEPTGWMPLPEIGPLPGGEG